MIARPDTIRALFVGLSDPATDRIVFGEGIMRGDVSLSRTGDGHLIVRYGAGDEIRVEGQYSVAGSDIERIVRLRCKARTRRQRTAGFMRQTRLVRNDYRGAELSVQKISIKTNTYISSHDDPTPLFATKNGGSKWAW